MEALQAGGADTPSDAAPGTPQRARRRHRRVLAAGAVLLVGVAAVAIVLLSSNSAGPRSTGGGIPPGDTTATVARRTLSESSTIDGTLGYGSTLELYDRLAGTFTWLPSVGAIISDGQALFRIDNEPVVLMYGSVPAYREMKQGISDGPDVSELNDNLIALGYDPYGAIGERDHFGEATAAAVKRWQEAEGLSQTGAVQLGRVVFAPGARRVTAVKVALGQDPPEASGSPAPSPPTATAPASTAPASTTPASTPPAPASTAPTSTAPASTTPAAAAPKPKSKSKPKPSGHEHQHPAQPSKSGHEPASSPSKPASTPSPRSETSKSNEGSKEPSGNGGEGSAGAGEVVLSTTSTQQLVQLKVKAEQQQLAHLGELAPVLLPGGSTVTGRITSVGTVASSGGNSEGEKGGNGGSSPSGSEGESATVAVTLTLERRVPHLDEAPVSVELLKSIRHNVLAVPATALTATAGGGYAIQTLDGGRVVPLLVTPGLFAQGFVQIEGAGLRPGLAVLVPQ